MKKRVAKKLTLHRETLRPLESREVEMVQGAGASGRPICCTTSGSCPPITAANC